MFYKLTSVVKDKGCVPQVVEMLRQHSPEAFRYANDELNPERNGTVPAPSPLLRPCAKLTDRLDIPSPSFPFLTVNERLLQFLQSVQSNPWRILPTTAIKKGVPYPYWMAIIDERHAEYVDYPASKFWVEYDGSERMDISISDVDEYRRIMAKNEPYRYDRVVIVATQVVLKTNIIKHDIFRLPNFALANYFVSERFREEAEKAKFTNVGFEPVESIA